MTEDKPVGKNVPGWVVDYITFWKEKLLLHEWDIRTSLSPDPSEEGDGNCRAVVQVYPDYVIAVIKFRDDIPDDISQVDEIEAEKWQRDVLHELVHIRLGRMTHFVQEELISPNYSPSQNILMDRMFRREVEPAVEIMAAILYGLSVSK